MCSQFYVEYTRGRYRHFSNPPTTRGKIIGAWFHPVPTLFVGIILPDQRLLAGSGLISGTQGLA